MWRENRSQTLFSLRAKCWVAGGGGREVKGEGVSEQLSSSSSPNPTLPHVDTSCSLRAKCCLRVGVGGQFPYPCRFYSLFSLLFYFREILLSGGVETTAFGPVSSASMQSIHKALKTFNKKYFKFQLSTKELSRIQFSPKGRGVFNCSVINTRIKLSVC